MANPYQPPIDASSSPSPARAAQLEELRAIARHQRAINLAILAQLALMVFAGSFGTTLELVLKLAGIVVAIISLVAEVRLVKALHGLVVAILCAPLMFVPLVNLLTLLVFNSQATKRIREAGFKVGLLGGNPDEIR